MDHFKFFKYLALATLASVMVHYLLDSMIDLKQHQRMLWWSVGFYLALSVFTYLIIDRSLKKSNGASFIGLVMMNVLIKLIASFGLVALYVKQFQPQEKSFIVPFLSTYLIFTLLETYFMNVQAREVR